MENLTKLCDSYIEVCNMITELDAQRDALKSQILGAIGDNELTFAGGHVIKNIWIESSRLDSKKLAQAVPDEIIQACKSKIVYNKLTVK